MTVKIANVSPTIEIVPQAHPLDAVAVCHDCGKPLPKRDGHLSYWSKNIPHPTMAGGILTVKICETCRHAQEDAQHGDHREAVAGRR